MAGRNWFDPAPLNVPYPWSGIIIPWTTSLHEAEVLTDQIKQKGNESFKRGDFYDALWKYEHSVTLLSYYPALTANVPIILCNMAASCLKLGDERREDLIKEVHLKLFMHEGTWYLYCSQYATQALAFQPDAKIAHKAHWRRGESAKKIFAYPGMLQAIESVLRFMPRGMDPIEVMVSDYVSCFELQEIPDPKVLREAIVLAVEHDQVSLLPILTERHVNDGIVTSVLKEIMSAPNMTPEHLECFLLDMSIKSSSTPHFDASWLHPAVLFENKVYDVEIYRKLIDCGMIVSASSVEAAVSSFYKGKLNLFKVLVSECTEKDKLFRAGEMAASLKKKNFIDVLREYSAEPFDKLKESGNSFFSRGEYSEALSKYYEAISFCKRRNMRDELALIRANCAQACLKLENFHDAYIHSCECIKADSQNHKGYFRRAEALRLLLASSSSALGTHMDVVKDYLKCHSLQANLDAFSKAVIMAVEHRCTRVLPKLRRADVSIGFSNKVFQYIMEKATLTEDLLEFVVLKLPDSQVNVPYDTTFISLRTILKVTTMPLVVTQLVIWGMSIEEEDILEAAIYISDSKAALLDLILNHNAINNEEAYQMCINRACGVALAAKKTACVLTFMRHGSTPPPDKLSMLPDLCDEPLVKKYFEVLFSMQNSQQKAIEGGDTSVECAKLKVIVGELNKSAKECFKSNNIEDAKKNYNEALSLCEFYLFEKESASLHNNLAHLYIQTKQYQEAYYHCNACIEVLPDNSKAYFRRAESLKSAIKSKEYNIKVPKSLTICDAIADYLKSYRLQHNLKALVEAIPLAIEYGQLSLICQECSTLAEDSCTTVLLELMKRKDCMSNVLMFLMTTAWKSKKIDCSRISMKSLVVDKGVISQKLLARFLESGVLVSVSCIHAAVCYFPDANLDSFKLLLHKCEKADKTDLCQEALKAKRISFVLYLIENGASLPKDHEMIIHCLLKLKHFEGVKMIMKLLSKDAIERMDLARLLENNLVLDHNLIEMLIKAGVNPNGKKSPITTVMSLHHLKLENQIQLVCLLIKCGANFNQLSHARTNTTALHVATELSLKSDGQTDLIKVVASSLSCSGSNKSTNEKGETPLHIAVKPHLKRDISSKVLSALLNTGLIDSSLKDKSNRKAADYLQPTDPRVKIFNEYSSRKELKPKKKPKKKKKSKGSENISKPETEAPIPLDLELNNGTLSELTCKEFAVLSFHENKNIYKRESFYEEKSLAEKLAYHIDRVTNEDDSYFQVQEEVEACLENTQNPLSDVTSLPKGQHVPLSWDLKKKSSLVSRTGIKLLASRSAEPISKLSNGITEGSSWTEFGSDLCDLPNFDDLPWEVEITRSVVKFFKNTKKYSRVDRISAARVIYSLAEGRRSDHLSKKVGSNPKTCLYEARITAAGRILWEKAISYSSKLTGQSVTAVYTQVIRVWEVLLDHDDLVRKISYCIEQIEQSYKQGYMASVCWALKPVIHRTPQKAAFVRGQEVFDLPSTYTVQSHDLLRSDYHFVPAASIKDTEYNVTTFYSFDSMTVKSMIAGTNERRDYPFKEWQKEHEIIKIKSSEAILLLGRSGTGKTTCCLYRLWNEFKNHWDPASKTFGWKIPRKGLISFLSYEAESRDLLVRFHPELQTCYSDAIVSSEYESKNGIEFKNGIKPEEIGSPCSSSYDENDSLMEVIEENLHQVFVSKNYVLCDQMKKRFYSMAAAYDFLDNHLPYEDVKIPNSFSKFEDLFFPAFLTARQFYILLDNSLEDGKNFFVRDEYGNLQVKIASLDYDHEDQDLLWDFEESDSEDDDMEVLNFTSEQPSQKQRSVKWTEVTALYFKEMIWPKVAHQRKLSKRVDPMLVWLEIQSFIKGSDVSIIKGSPLNLNEYKAIGNKIAPNFSSHREMIYKLYESYERYKQNLRHSCYLFDECDLIMDLHQRLKKIKDVPWSIHSVYIDEVQDFTQAELAVFIHCSRDPNSMFFTGDTAQSIMRGIAFRFQDLRTCFYMLNCNTPSVGVPQKPLNLTINYRSHSGILKLAGSVIDLIKEFFRDSIDHLPDDQGMFPGPVPVFLDSCKEDDLSLLLSTNKRECSTIEFGAHQVILVQSKEAKDNIPQILKGAIVLTIFESKGLEFDDVLIYNFFTDSMVDETMWRVVASYLEMHSEKIENLDKLPGAISEARSKTFDAVQHKSLNAELKYLYTAVTRAKCNLWIYDSNVKARLPMLNYWHKRNAVRIVTADSGVDQKYSMVFASNSTPDQWKAQGDNFRKKHLWEQAILCYKRAGPDFIHLVKEAQAYNLLQGARLQKAWLFHEAALNFFESDDSKHSVQCICGAALCLKNSKPPRYNQAAKLFERLGDLVKAAQSYLKARDYENFSRVQESRGEYDSVIRSLLGKPFMRKRDALAKMDEYEKKGYHLDPKYTTSELSFSCAKFYSERKDKHTLLEVLKYMPELEKRLKFMKEAELYEEAYKVCVANKQFAGAYRLALAHDWCDKAIDHATQEGHELKEATFTLLGVKSSYLSLLSNSSGKDVPDSVLISKLKMISKLNKVAAYKEDLVKAEAHLLLGMIQRIPGPCIIAKGIFNLKKHKAGILEAFEQVRTFGKVSDQEILDCCHIAKRASKTLSEAMDMNIDVQQAVKFYGLQLVGKAYLTSHFYHVWINFDTLQKYKYEDAEHDLDHMIRLKPEVREVIANRYQSFIPSWLSQFKLESRLYAKWRSFKLYSDIWEKRCLSHHYSLEEVSSAAMMEYVQNCVHVLELRLLRDKTVDAMLFHFVIMFSPTVSSCLPCLNDQHVNVVRRSVNSLSCFKRKIEDDLKRLCEEHLQRISIDSWLDIWRLSSLSSPSMKQFLSKLDALEEDQNSQSTKRAPLGYVFWKSDQRYLHIFRFWLNSCKEIRENSKVLWAAKLAINHFLGNTVEDKRIFISIRNSVNVLTVHCMSLFAMITHSNALLNYPQKFVVPQTYKHVVQMFNHMNCRKGTSDASLPSACVKEVSSHHDVRKVFTDCKVLLNRAMSYLVGTYERAPKYSLLKFGLTRYPDSDQTLECLILTLTLFGNLSAIQGVQKYEAKISNMFREFVSKNKEVPQYVKRVNEVYREEVCRQPRLVFELVEELLTTSKKDSTISRIMFKRKHNKHGHVEIIPIINKPLLVKQGNSLSSGDVQFHPNVSLKDPPLQPFPSLSELGATPHGPIGRERKASSGKCIVSGLPPINPSFPSVVPYAHGLPHSVNSKRPHLPPEYSDPLSVNFTHNNVLCSHDSAIVHAEPSLMSDMNVDPSLPAVYSQGVPAFATPSPTISSLSVSAEQFIPRNFLGNISAPLQGSTSVTVQQQQSSDVVSSLGVVQSNSTECGMCTFDENQYTFPREVPAEKEYLFLSESPAGNHYPFQSEAPADEELLTNEDDFEVGYMLTNQENPALDIDPSVITKDIIDEENNFCNACGTNYQHDDLVDLDEDVEGKPILESYITHVTASAHNETSKAFVIFIEAAAESNETLNLAEVKLQECLYMKEQIETEQLDHAIDNLKEEIDTYNLTAAEVKENRKWGEGFRSIVKSKESLHRLLIEANDLLLKAEIAKYKEQLKSKERMVELEEDQDEIEKLSEAYVNDVDDKPVQRHKQEVRTEQQKVMARKRKREKRKATMTL